MTSEERAAELLEILRPWVGCGCCSELSDKQAEGFILDAIRSDAEKCAAAIRSQGAEAVKP